MSAVRRVAGLATDLTCQLVGRRIVVRVARFVLMRARLDYPNDLTTNGESALQRWILDLSQAGEPIHVADIGANVGRWSKSMLAAASQARRDGDLKLHAFEPDTSAFDRLTRAIEGPQVVLNESALSDRHGVSPFHVVAPGAGTNSLYLMPGADPVARKNVATITLDWYAEQAGVGRFALVKIDAEGHDLVVMRGARNLLAEHRIAVIQFEYNHRWIFANFYLRDAFEFLLPLGYRIGKVTPRGVEFYPSWDVDLETFAEGNYVACDLEAARGLPTVTWWKSH